ncbi:hypothetical protein DNTS_004558 [Danionella cerebrum]|uniref:Uncharacterized protein n=1 Tax=Danionella cerebrum TaxID=2873325 RepID=A0A553PJ23_9TELE|nr:hypothetical protein DNTS_004558 [Danionella translucida]
MFLHVLAVCSVRSQEKISGEQAETAQNEPQQSSSLPVKTAKFFDFKDEREKEAFLHRSAVSCAFTFPAKLVISSSIERMVEPD